MPLKHAARGSRTHRPKLDVIVRPLRSERTHKATCAAKLVADQIFCSNRECTPVRLHEQYLLATGEKHEQRRLAHIRTDVEHHTRIASARKKPCVVVVGNHRVRKRSGPYRECAAKKFLRDPRVRKAEPMADRNLGSLNVPLWVHWRALLR